MQAWRVVFGMMLGAVCLGLLGLGCSETATATERQAGGAFVNVGTHDAPLRLWVEEEGRGDPVLMIHGFGASTYTWRYLAPALVGMRHVISVDLKGAGRSDKPFDESYGVLDQARLLKTLIIRKGLRHLTLVGHSFGGGVALALTLDLNRTHPGTVERLVLIDSVAFRQPLPLFIQLLQTPVLAEVGIYATLPEIEAYKGLLAAYHDPSKITFEAVRTYARPLYEAGGRYALLKTAQEIIPPNLSALVAGYPTIHQPTLLIWCAEDRVIPLAVGRRLARTLPRARLAVLNGCGHAPQEELPAATRALLRGFLR